MAQHQRERRPIDGNQASVERIARFRRDAPAHQVADQYRHQRDRDTGCGGHGIGLGECQRLEHPAFLGFQCEDRHEAQGNDQDRVEQRRPDLDCRIGHRVPAFLADQPAA